MSLTAKSVPRKWQFFKAQLFDAYSTQPLTKKQALRIVFASIFITLLICRFSGIFSVLEYALFDMMQRNCKSATQSDAIVMIGITTEEIEADQAKKQINKWTTCACGTVFRSRIGNVISRIKAADVKAIGLDLTFDSACGIQEGSTNSHDGPLINALRKLPKNVALVGASNSNPDGTISITEPLEQIREIPGLIITSPEVQRPYGVIRSVSLIQRGTPTHLDREQAGPVELKARIYPPLALAIYAIFTDNPTSMAEEVNSDFMQFQQLLIPTWSSIYIRLFKPVKISPEITDKHAMLIRWSGPSGTFLTYSFKYIEQASPETLKKIFAGKIVMLGALSERRLTPMQAPGKSEVYPLVDQSHERSLSGLEIHANALNTIMQKEWITTLPNPVNWFIIFFSTLLVGYTFRKVKTGSAVCLMLVQIVFLIVFAFILFGLNRWFFAVIPSVATLFAGAMSAVWGYAEAKKQAQDLATAVQARDAVTNTLVHDLKQPLATISVLSATIRMQQEKHLGAPEMSPALLEMIQKQVEQALGDIDELLLANPERTIHLKYQNFDIIQLVHDLTTTYMMRSSVHEIKVTAPDEAITLLADPQYIGRALNNLIENALKYSPEGGQVEVVVEAQKAGVLISVKDDGIGISPDQHERIFECFTRVVPPQYAIAGTGVGLFSVRRIIEAHGGTVIVKSELDKGATFTLYLPYQVPALS